MVLGQEGVVVIPSRLQVRTADADTWRVVAARCNPARNERGHGGGSPATLVRSRGTAHPAEPGTMNDSREREFVAMIVAPKCRM